MKKNKLKELPKQIFEYCSLSYEEGLLSQGMMYFIISFFSGFVMLYYDLLLEKNVTTTLEGMETIFAANLLLIMFFGIAYITFWKLEKLFFMMGLLIFIPLIIGQTNLLSITHWITIFLFLIVSQCSGIRLFIRRKQGQHIRKENICDNKK